MKPFKILTCRNFADYYRTVAEEHFPSISVCALPYGCPKLQGNGNGPRPTPALTDIPAGGYLIVCSSCPLLKALPERETFPVLVDRWRFCPSMILSPGIVSEFESMRSFFITSGSLPSLLTVGAGQKDIFSTGNSRLVYVSVNGECPPELETLSHRSGLPCTVIPADRDYIRLIVERHLADHELRGLKRRRQADLDHFRKCSSDYGAMLSIIGRLTRSDSEETVLTLLQQALQAIFGAGKVVWHNSDVLEISDSSGGIAAAFREDPLRKYVLNPSTPGFWVRVEHAGGTLGFLELDEFRFSRYRQSYLEFTINTSQVIGLSLANARAFEKLQKNEERFRHFSLHDPLTGLGNRFNFNRTIKEARSERRGAPYAVMVCDLDGLKELNDSLGHSAGDRAIVTTANILKKCLRDGDSLSRIGGDEFAAIIGKCSGSVIETIRTRIKQTIIETNGAGENHFPVDFSTGFCLAEGIPPDMEKAFRQADDRMYAAKRAKKAGLLAE